MTAPLLAIENITGGYTEADMILKSVSVTLGQGELAAIIGPNGAGKSTLLKAIAGLVKVREGVIRFDGHDIANRPPRSLTAMGLAFVPQEANVFPSLSVTENLEMGAYLEPKAAPARIEQLFQRFPVLAEKRRQPARTLSGGQRQILAVAMALMVQPKVLLLDEPSAGLSPVAAGQLFETITAINREGVAILIVEQNALDALAIAARAYILVDGRNAREGPARDLAADPEIRRLFLGGAH